MRTKGKKIVSGFIVNIKKATRYTADSERKAAGSQCHYEGDWFPAVGYKGKRGDIELYSNKWMCKNLASGIMLNVKWG